MDRISSPYRASFSTSNAVVMALTSLAFKAGRLSSLAYKQDIDEASLEEAKAYLRSVGVKLTPSQARGLGLGENVKSAPIAKPTTELFKTVNKQGALGREFVERFAKTLWGEDVPVRLSRRVKGFDYPIPPHAKVDGLLDKTFAFLAQADGKVSPLLLSGLCLYMVMAIMPFSEHTLLLAILFAKGELISFRREFVGVNLTKHLLENEQTLSEAYAKANEKSDMAPYLIAYMGVVEEAIEEAIRRGVSKRGGLTPMAKRMVELMEEGRYYSAAELLGILGLKSRLGLQKNYLQPALKARLIEMSNPLSPTDRNQRYRLKK